MTSEDATSEALSSLYHSLRARRRRYLIQLLAMSDEDQLSVRSCARRIAAIEEGVPPEEASGEPYRSVYNSLSQTHLPALSDAKVIDYASDRQIVSGGPNLQFAVLVIGLNKVTYETLQGQHLTEFSDPKL